MRAKSIGDDTQTPASMTENRLRWFSFRELDEQWNAQKGTAFLAFKRALPTLREDIDFIYLSHEQHAEQIEHLRSAQRIYANSINVVLLAPEAITRLRN